MNKCVIINFSSRMNGNCQNISRFVAGHGTGDIKEFTIDSLNFAPCGDCDYECLKRDKLCPQLTEDQIRIMDELCNSSMIYFIIPNFCGLPCANYFAFNERSVGYFNLDREKMKRYKAIRKRFIVVSNTEGFEKFLQMQTNDSPEILYLKSSKYNKQSIAGDILDSEHAKADLEAFLCDELT